MTYYLKKYLPIVKTETKLKVGVRKEYIERPYNDDDVLLLEKLIKKGISKKEIENTTLYSEMYANGMLCDTLDQSRKEMFFEYMGHKIKPEILDTRILVLGAGGMGSTTAFLLAQFGFKHIAVSDFDIVEDSEIEKMVVYRAEHKGMTKLDALKEIIESNFPHCTVETKTCKVKCYEDLEELIEWSNPKLVIKAMDPRDVGFRLWLNEICYSRGIAFMSNTYSFQFIRFGPFCIPGVTPCDNCYKLWVAEKYGSEYNFEKMYKLFHDYTVHPSISFNINIASNLSLKDIIFYLLGEYDYVTSLARVIDYEVASLSGDAHEIVKHQNCNICS